MLIDKSKLNIAYIFIIIAMILSACFSVIMGHSNIGIMKLSKIILHNLFNMEFVDTWSQTEQSIIWQIRLPRTILAIVVGAGLATVGATLQAIMRNNLADPHLFGISSGGAFGAVTTILFAGSFAGIYSVSIGAFIGSLLAMGLIMAIAQQKRFSISSERLLLSGVACSFILISLTNLMIFMGEHRSAPSILFWMLGGLGLASWDKLLIPTFIMFICIPYLYTQSKNLNAMMSGEETAITLGINTTKKRTALFVICAVMTGVLVALSGAIGFVGLMIPHICRFIVGADNKNVILMSALLGAIFLIWTDIISRTIFAPQEIPVGIITAFIGGIFFVILISRKNI